MELIFYIYCSKLNKYINRLQLKYCIQDLIKFNSNCRNSKCTTKLNKQNAKNSYRANNGLE